jgi:hypothetical protein
VPWKCPVCALPLHHAEGDRPVAGALYRCHICRVELMFDLAKGKLVLAPIRDDDPQESRQ